MDNKKCLMVFVKFPEKGKVKSRLSEVFGTDLVLALYECFVFDLLETIGREPYPLKICFSPPERTESILRWIGKEYTYMPQEGNDLGERMKNAFMAAFSEGFSEVVLIGSDIPDLPAEAFHNAFAFDQYNASIGPASDGGYYLIGFKKDSFLPEIFNGIEWGTSTVLEKTMARFKKHAYSVRILPVWHDVDRPEDLQALYARNIHSEFAASRTMRFLSGNLDKFFRKIPANLSEGEKK